MKKNPKQTAEFGFWIEFVSDFGFRILNLFRISRFGFRIFSRVILGQTIPLVFVISLTASETASEPMEAKT